MLLVPPLVQSTDQMMHNESPSRVPNVAELTSRDAQTDLQGAEVEVLRDFYDKYLEKQLKLDVNLR